ncbi:MAG: hypothetical protein ACK48G_04585 [Chitinophagaceae bacterium]|jgi:hypothetical protein
MFHNQIDKGIQLFLSPSTKKRSEQVILLIAIASYLIHLGLIALSNFGVLPSDSKFLSNPISAIYTPFSFILIYEVYLLLFYLPKSTSFYIGKQYEIMTLIVIRRIFKDLGDLELVKDWFQNENDLRFTIDALTSLILFLLIYLFYHKILRREQPANGSHEISVSPAGQFVFLKKIIALLLVPVLIVLAIYSFTSWVRLVLNNGLADASVLAYTNNIFFDEFFTILIVVDVLLLLASFFYSDRFHTIIRNSGFVLSTIMLKISFSVSGILNNLLIVGSVIFGLLILYIHQLFERSTPNNG